MKSYAILLLNIFLVLQVSAESLPHWDDSFHQPFWRKKPEVQKRMDQENLVVVSASTDKIQDKPLLYEMKVVAGGDVKTPLDFTFKMMSDYEKLKDADSHFQEVKYDKVQKTVFMRVEALGYHADMNLRVNEIDKGKTKEIHWECFKGSFEGMKGVFQVVEIERQKSEISMTADYRSEKLPLPKILMGLGLEIVGKQVATQLRKYILEQYKK